MSVKVATNRFILPPSTKLLGFYQEFQTKIVDYDELGNSLIKLSEEARAFRRIDELKELSLHLSNFPLTKFRIVGQYYFALSLHHSMPESTETACKIMETVAEKAPLRYRAEALLSLGRLCWPKSSEGMRYFLEAGGVSNSLLA
jgi:hypothetical protein